MFGPKKKKSDEDEELVNDSSAEVSNEELEEGDEAYADEYASEDDEDETD